MEELNNERTLYGKKIRLQLRNLLLVLIVAIIFSFLMGVLASIFVIFFILNGTFTLKSLYISSVVIIIAAEITWGV